MISRDLEGNEYEITADDLTWRPSAYGIVIRKNKILLVKERGKFHLPGGGIDLGESPDSAVLREVREETGCTVKNPKLITMASSFFSYRTSGSPPHLQHVQSLLIYYACEYIHYNPNDIHLDKYEQEAGLEMEWVDSDRLGDIPVGTTVDWRPAVRQVLEMVPADTRK